MSKDAFWTDELVNDACYHVGLNIKSKEDILSQIPSLVQSFKQSKMPKKEWEIVEFISPRGGKIRKEDDATSWDEWGVKSFAGLTINAVKRFPSNEIFEVGELVGSKHRSSVFIRSFVIQGGDMIVKFEQGESDCELYWLTKLPPQSKPEQPKRIEVGMIDCQLPHDPTMVISLNAMVGEDKFPAIKAAIEEVINDEDDETKIYTKEDHNILIEAAQSAAFNAARKMVHSGSYIENQLEKVLKSSLKSMAAYKDASDYLNHKSKQ